MTVDPFAGLIAATHTPFGRDGSLNLQAVERLAAHLRGLGVDQVFINGTTGEGASLTVDERLRLAERWSAVAKDTGMRLIVHVGSNCLNDARTLAAQAEQLGASGVSAVAPSYFKPASVPDLVACCREIASAAPSTPFFYYDIPPMTGIRVPFPEFLEAAADQIATFQGLKYSNEDLVTFQLCRAARGGTLKIFWGVDEILLSALLFGASGAVGSTYNFIAPLYRRMIEAFDRGDLDQARQDQFKTVRFVQVLSRRGFMPSAKALLGFLGVDVGSPRLPIASLDAAQAKQLRAEIESLELFPLEA